MMKLQQLIQDMCPNGVEFKKLGEVCTCTKGEQLNKSGLLEEGYPVINGGINPSGYWPEYNYPANTITISQGGASAGYVNYLKTPFWAGAHCYVLINTIPEVDYKFLYYLVKQNESAFMQCQYGAGIPALGAQTVNALEIPIPPLEIQKKIVECLDKFSALAAELQAELQKRRTQYEYYRTRLLTPPPTESNSADKSDDCNWKWKTLGEIAKYRRGSFPQPYGNQEWYDGEGAMPFVQVADVEEEYMSLKPTTKQFISRLAMPKSVFVPEGSVVVTLQGSIGKVAITQYDSYVDRTLGIFESFKIDINKRYFAYQLKRIFAIKREKARGGTIKTITKEEFTDFEIPIPSIKEQERIVNILDKFESLTNSLSDGIPAEQVAQQKRYEYYRDLLLTFPRKEV